MRLSRTGYDPFQQYFFLYFLLHRSELLYTLGVENPLLSDKNLYTNYCTTVNPFKLLFRKLHYGVLNNFGKRFSPLMHRCCYCIFKGTVSRDFLLLFFFSWISFPPAPEYPIRTVLNFLENSRRYSQVKVHHRYQRHRYQRHRRQFAAGINDTGGKFATGINDTGGKFCQHFR